MTQHIIKNLQELQEFADKIAGEIRLCDENSGNLKNIICLSGDLGAGKTEFSRAFINSFSDEDVVVTSPTYNIVQVYELADIKIQHFDLYRLEYEQELLEIGFDEATEEDICLIEWPQIAKNVLKPLQKQIINLEIEILDDESRRITIS